MLRDRSSVSPRKTSWLGCPTHCPMPRRRCHHVDEPWRRPCSARATEDCSEVVADLHTTTGWPHRKHGSLPAIISGSFDIYSKFKNLIYRSSILVLGSLLVRLGCRLLEHRCVYRFIPTRSTIILLCERLVTALQILSNLQGLPSNPHHQRSRSMPELNKKQKSFSGSHPLCKSLHVATFPEFVQRFLADVLHG